MNVSDRPNGRKRSWNVHANGQVQWTVVTLNGQERLGTFEPERSNSSERIMENFHRTFTFTLQKRKKYCFFIKYYIPNPKIIKLSLFSNQIIIPEYSVFFRFLSSLMIYFQTIFGFLIKKIFQSCSWIVRKNDYLSANFLTIDLAKS